MKFIRTAVLALIAMFALAFGALGDTNTVSVSPYQAKEFAVSTFGTYQASGAVTGDSQWGVGIQADYFVTKNIGVNLATSKNRFGDGAFIQNLSIGPVIRLPLKDTGFAPYVLGGIGFDFDFQNQEYYYAGGGVEYRPRLSFTKHLSVFTDAQYQWRDYLPDDGDGVVVRAGVRWVF